MKRLYAHRGAAAEEPENTLPGFALAVSYGVHGLEMDVHMTSDGHVVVAHDLDGTRMCNQNRAIRNTPLAELSTWDAGWGFTNSAGARPFAEKGYTIPRFSEILEAFPDIIINVDLKQCYPSMVASVLKTIRQAGAEERVILASFSQLTLLHIRASGYSGQTALGVVELLMSLYVPSRIVSSFPLRGQAAQIPTHHGKLQLATPEKIARLQSAGARVDFWTINDPLEAQKLLAMGADGIMTDDPKRLAPVFSTT